MSDLNELQFDSFDGLNEDDGFMSDNDELDEDIVEIIRSSMNKDGLDPVEFTDSDDDDSQEQYDDL